MRKRIRDRVLALWNEISFSRSGRLSATERRSREVPSVKRKKRRSREVPSVKRKKRRSREVPSVKRRYRSIYANNDPR